jgi:hypothetical protein
MTAEGRNTGTKAAIARQQQGKQLSTATNKHATIQDTVFPMWPLLGNGYVCNKSRTIGNDVFSAVRAKAI